MSQQFKGPFGLWPFPIINMLMQMMQSRQTTGALGQVAKALPSAVKRIRNEEKWEWTDYKGRHREFTIHRDVTEE